MELRHYLQILERRKWVVIIVAVVTVVIVVTGTLLATPSFTSSATIRVAQIQDKSVDNYDLNYTQRLINTYVELIRSRPFLEQAIDRMGLDVDAADLAKVVTVEAIPNTELLKLSAQSQSPVIAMDLANTLGALIVEEGERLYSGQGKTVQEILLEQLTGILNNLQLDRERLQLLLEDDSGVDQSGEIQDLNTRVFVQEQTYARVLDAYGEARVSDEAKANSISIAVPAEVPEIPTEPKVLLNIALGAMVGLVGGIALALVRENLDLAIYSPDDLDAGAQTALLGSIPNLKVPAKLRGAPLLLRQNGGSAAVEAFRLLRSNVLTLHHGRTPRTVLVTSVEDDAGKSTVLANLAVALAQLGRKVVAVDTDLRNPKLAEVFGVPNDRGLKSVLIEGGTLEHAARQTKVPGVLVLPSGPLPHNPADLLGLQSMRQLISDIAGWADLVLLDSPSILQYSDAVVLAPLVDSVILVVGRGGVSGGQIQKAAAQLSKVGVDQVGFVFNREE